MALVGHKPVWPIRDWPHLACVIESLVFMRFGTIALQIMAFLRIASFPSYPYLKLKKNKQIEISKYFPADLKSTSLRWQVKWRSLFLQYFSVSIVVTEWLEVYLLQIFLIRCFSYIFFSFFLGDASFPLFFFFFIFFHGELTGFTRKSAAWDQWSGLLFRV